MAPYYISIGMTHEQYWYGEPFIAKEYHEAHLLQNDQKNQELYLMGHYVFDAIMIALSNVHLDGKKYPMNKYLKQPYDIRPKTETKKEEEKEKARQHMINSLTAWKNAWDSSHKK